MSKHVYDSGDCCLEIELQKIGRDRVKIFEVAKVSGRWPVDYDLVTICDGGDPDKTWAEQMHKGGAVIACEKGKKTVRVNT